MSIYLAIGKGVLQVMQGDNNALADYIPVDIMVNMMICVAWQTANEFKESNNVCKRVKVYNCTSSQSNPLKWGHVGQQVVIHTRQNPMEKILFPPNFLFTKNPLRKHVYKLFKHSLPAYLGDILLRVCGKKTL